MTNPYGYHDYDAEVGVLSDTGRQEWDQFKQRRQELLNEFFAQAGALAHGPGGPLEQQQPMQPLGGPVPTIQQQGIEDETRRDLLARADFWKIPNAAAMTTEQLWQAIGAKRAEIKQAPQTTVGSAASAFGASAEEAVASTSRLIGNLLHNVVGEAPFIGNTLKSLLATEQSKKWLYDWSSKLDESAMMIQAQQPEADRTAAQFLTATGKVAGTALPMIAAWEALGAAGAGINAPGWFGRATPAIARLGLRGGLTSAAFDDPNSSPEERIKNFGLGVVLGSSQMFGPLGVAAGGALIGGGIGQGIGDTPEQQSRNQKIGAVLGALAPFASRAFVKVRQGFPSAFDQKLNDAIDAQPSRPQGEVMADYEISGPANLQPITNDVGQISGNPPKSLKPGVGAVQSPEDLALLFQSEPPRSLAPSGQLEVGAPQVRGLLPAQTSNASVTALIDMESSGLNDAIVPRDPAEISRDQQRLSTAIFQAQRYAPPEAKGFASVTTGKPQLLGSKVADAQGRPLRVYHGTGLDFEEFDPTKANPDALFGPGFYHTESTEISGGTGRPNGVGWSDSTPDLGYSGINYQDQTFILNQIESYNQAIQQAIDSGMPSVIADLQQRRDEYASQLSNMRRPNVRPAWLDIKNPFDIDGRISREDAHQLVNRLEKELPGYNWDQARSAIDQRTMMAADIGFSSEPPPDLTNERLYELLSAVETSQPVQNAERAPVGNWLQLDTGGPAKLGKAGVNDALQRLGYDGITHIGGARTGNEPHRVWIAFRPEQIHAPWDVQPLSPSEAAGTAQSMTKQATVLESSTLPEAVAKPEVTDSDAIAAVKATNPGGVSILRDIGRPIEALIDHPDIKFVERDGKLDAIVGEATPNMVSDYKHWGVYESQIVVTPRGVEGTILNINGRGIATVMRKAGGPPIRIKASSLLPTRFSDPIRNVPDLWNSFKADLLRSANEEFDKASMRPADSIFDSRVLEMMQQHMEDYLDRRGINDQGDRQAIDALFNQRFVDEAKDLDPEMRDLQAKITDMLPVEDTRPVATEDIAASRGFIWIKEPGTAGGILRDNLSPESAQEIPMASDKAARDFLREVDRALPDASPVGDIPVEVQENIPTDTMQEPHAGIEDQQAAVAEAGWRKFAKESVPIRRLGAAHARALRENYATATERINAILDETQRQREIAQARRAAGGGGGGQEPPVDPTLGGYDPMGELPGGDEELTLGEQFDELAMSDLPKYMQIQDQFRNSLFRYTRYNMAKLESVLVDAGIDKGRAWAHYEAAETARVISDNEAHPWLVETGQILRQFPNELMRDGTIFDIHQIQDTNERFNAWHDLTDRGYSDHDIARFIEADDQLTDFHRRWFEFLTGDPTFALTAEREIYRYISNVRARQAFPDHPANTYDSTGYLSPNTQFFAEFAREGNLQFKLVDPREIIPYMIRAAMFKKYQAAPWGDLVRIWSDERIPVPIRDMMLDHAHALKFGYDASGDMAVQAIRKILSSVFDLQISTREATQLIAGPMNMMYMSMLAGRGSIFFRDALQPLGALAKVRVPFMSGVYADVFKGVANRETLSAMYKRGLRGGWVMQEQPAIEGVGVFEDQGGLRQNELIALTDEQAARRERVARVLDQLQGLPAWLVRPSESSFSTLKLYGKQQQLHRLITGEAAWRQASTYLSEFRASQTAAALAGDPSTAMSYEEFANKAFFNSFQDPINNKLRELVDAGHDEEAANLFARQVDDWANHRFGRREAPKITRTTAGRWGFMLGNFSGQYAEAQNAALRYGTPSQKARNLMVQGVIAGALALVTYETGWNFTNWIWGRSLAFAGGPALTYSAQLVGALGAGVALSDDRTPAPWQTDALRATGGISLGGAAMNFFPYAGYIRSAAEYSAAAQGINPVEQALRYTITGDRGSRIDLQREDQQRADEMLRLIDSVAASRGQAPPQQPLVPSKTVPGVMVPQGSEDSAGPPILRNPRYQYQRLGHPGGGAMQ